MKADSALFNLLAPDVIVDIPKVAETLKPGAHLLALSPIATHHSNTIGIEDAGMEIRDTLSYVFDSGVNTPGMILVTVARKLLTGSVADNVLRWGTGGLNIDPCRVGTDKVSTHSRGSNGAFPKRPGERSAEESGRKKDQRDGLDHSEREGRWPANLLHCGSEGVKAMFPKTNKQALCKSDDKSGWQSDYVGGSVSKPVTRVLYLDDDNGGSAARFFHSAPCLNNLLAYLLKLVTPPDGTVLTNCDTDNLPSDYTYVTNSEH